MTTTTIEQKLNRQAAMRANMDPFGNQWGISLIDGTSLYRIGKAPEDGKGPVSIPKNYPHVDGEPSGIDGMFTRTDYAQKAIEEYLRKAWDFAEIKQVKQERKEYAKSQNEDVLKLATETGK